VAARQAGSEVGMSLNPIDWTAGPFLQFYLLLMLTTLAASILLRINARGAGGRRDSLDLDFIELACLVGGRTRAADAVLVAFMTAGATTIDFRQRILWRENAEPLPRELERFRVRGSVGTRKEFHAAIAKPIDDVYRDLSRRGLAPSPEALSRLAMDTMIVMAIPMVLGIVKIIVGGVIRGHPTGKLAMMVCVTGFLATLLIVRPPRRTPAGEQALRASRSLHARAARAPLRSELALAFAIAGPAVLFGTPYEALARHIQASSSGGGGCGGGGCGGGGGGGGCGGCGGG
jgi:uncharacterized protein (TIGR04222 family)